MRYSHYNFDNSDTSFIAISNVVKSTSNLCLLKSYTKSTLSSLLP